ncbi:MAG: helix-turn-helix domain-containing protein [Armatimonadota bacterium]
MLPFCKVVLCAQKPFPPDYPAQPTTIGEHIKRRRYELRMTQQQVAEFFGIAHSTISGWESNATVPNIILAPKVSQFLCYVHHDNHSTMTAGDRIRAARKILGLTLEEAAKQFGVCKDTFTAWEYGRVAPRKRNMNSLNQFMDSAFHTDMIGEYRGSREN